MTIGTDALKYTLKARIPDRKELKESASKETTPGPGSYQPIGIDSVGKYILSTIP